MGLSNGSLQDVTAKRRELVASLRLRGHTEREIVEVIAKKSEYRNPVTGKARTNGTINTDLVALRQ